jgi:hypothetical protein
MVMSLHLKLKITQKYTKGILNNKKKSNLKASSMFNPQSNVTKSKLNFLKFKDIK